MSSHPSILAREIPWITGLGKLWTEVYNIIQEVVIKTIPRKKKGKKAKQLPEDALQIEKRNDRQRRKGKVYPFECSSEE